MLSALKPTQLKITCGEQEWLLVCPPCEAHIRDADAEIISKSPMSECVIETSLRRVALELDAVFSIGKAVAGMAESMSTAKPSRQLVIMAWLADHPGSTSREVATMLVERNPTHSELNTAHAALRSLADRGDVEIEAGSWPMRWRLLERALEPETLPDPSPPLPRPEYVDVVIKRLAELRKVAPERCHHDLDYCMVDLQRALGRVPG